MSVGRTFGTGWRGRWLGAWLAEHVPPLSGLVAPAEGRQRRDHTLEQADVAPGRAAAEDGQPNEAGLGQFQHDRLLARDDRQGAGAAGPGRDVPQRIGYWCRTPRVLPGEGPSLHGW